jgi:hypothetical protein
LPTVSLSVFPTSVHTGGTAIFTITASSVSPTNSVTVNYTMGGNAVNGSQYSLSGAPGQVTIPAGASSANVTLSVTSGPSRSAQATMTLTSGSGYTLSSSRSATVTISR